MVSNKELSKLNKQNKNKNPKNSVGWSWRQRIAEKMVLKVVAGKEVGG